MRSATIAERTNGTLLVSRACREVVRGQAVFRPEKAVARVQASINELKHRVSGATLPSN
jgi:hypothetical protein